MNFPRGPGLRGIFFLACRKIRDFTRFSLFKGISIFALHVLQLTMTKSPALKAVSTVLIFLFAVSCVNHELPNYTCTSSISYSATVSEIVATKCAISGCHNGSLGDQRDWRQVARLQEHKTLVKEYTRNRVMPPAGSPAGPLSQDQIDAISCWVDQGAPNN